MDRIHSNIKELLSLPREYTFPAEYNLDGDTEESDFSFPEFNLCNFSKFLKWWKVFEQMVMFKKYNLEHAIIHVKNVMGSEYERLVDIDFSDVTTLNQLRTKIIRKFFDRHVVNLSIVNFMIEYFVNDLEEYITEFENRCYDFHIACVTFERPIEIHDEILISYFVSHLNFYLGDSILIKSDKLKITNIRDVIELTRKIIHKKPELNVFC